MWENSVAAQDSLSEGIGVNNTTGTATWNNSITGADGFDAIGLYSSTFATVIRNSVSGFTVDTSEGNAQIFLDPSTTHDLVVCAESSDTVLNKGTSNVVIGCEQSGATSTAPMANADSFISHSRRNLHRTKPVL